MSRAALAIGRNKSTVSRELRKNGGVMRYHPQVALDRANKHKKCRDGITKISRDPELQAYIAEKLKVKWSPQVIAARRVIEGFSTRISAEAIYQWCYSEEAREEKLYKLLSRHKKKRGMRKVRAEKPVDKVHITQRPEVANTRAEVGHIEVDLVFCSGSQSTNVLTAIDRKTRYVSIIKNESKHAEVIEEAIRQKLPHRLPFELLTATFDNGSEFAKHKNYQAQAYFCDPHSPWQKGSIEQFNGMLRSYLPFRESLTSVTQEKLDQIAYSINNIPRKLLGFLSPLELLKKLFNQDSQCVAL
jgi:IS30 family transposase